MGSSPFRSRKNGELVPPVSAGDAGGGVKEAALSQMQSYTADETFHFVQDMLTAHPEMRAIFVQTDAPSLGAVRAIQAAGREGQVCWRRSTVFRNSCP